MKTNSKIICTTKTCIYIPKLVVLSILFSKNTNLIYVYCFDKLASLMKNYMIIYDQFLDVNTLCSLVYLICTCYLSINHICKMLTFSEFTLKTVDIFFVNQLTSLQN